MKLLSVLLSVVGVSGLVWVSPVSAEMGGLASHRGGSRGERGGYALTVRYNCGFVPKGYRSHMAQNNLTRVTRVEVNQTESGLELILKTVAGSERLVPLILPEGNDLVIDILDATLAFSIRNGVTELNPAPGIRRITVNKGDENSVRVRIAGANQTPSAEVVTGRDDLVLSIAPEKATKEREPDEEIAVLKQF